MMTEFGHSRKIDDVGRIVLPRDLRQQLGWDSGDTLSFDIADDKITLRLLEKNSTPECFYCQKPELEVRVNGKDICADCLEKALEQLH